MFPLPNTAHGVTSQKTINATRKRCLTRAEQAMEAGGLEHGQREMLIKWKLRIGGRRQLWKNTAEQECPYRRIQS